jgi:hypothetical protein
MPQRSRAVALALLLGPLAPGLHAGSLDLGGARLVVSGEFLATLAPRERGYFNFTDYGTAPLRQARLDLATELRRGETFALVAEVGVRISEGL